MKLFKSKRLLSLLLTLVMVFGLLPAYQSATLADDTTAAVTDETAATVSVTFSAANGDSFIVSPITVTVTDGLAEAYGYKVSTDDGEGNAITGPTYFDALVAVHKAIYGDAFTAETATDYLTIEDTGLLTKAFGQENAFYSMQFVNCESCMSYCDQVQLADGDVLDYRVMQDTDYYSDYYTYFADVPSVIYNRAGVTLQLNGYKAVYGGTAVGIAGATISYRLADSDGEWTAAGTTDENGSIEITFPDEGDYDVIATGVCSNDADDTPILAAWADVNISETITVTFSAASGDDFIVEPRTVVVTDGLAEEYGFTVATEDHNKVAITGPTCFDALVAVHKAIYGDAFTPETAKDYIAFEYSYLTMAFGKSASSTMLVNGITPNDGIYVESYGGYTGYTYDTAQLTDGDVVEYRVMQDSYWSDYYTYFTNQESNVYANVSTSLTLRGYMAGWYGSSTQDTISAMTTEISGATISYRKEDGEQVGEWITAGTTDEYGNIEITFPEEGYYSVKATGVYSSDYGDTPILAAWTDVSVKGAVWDSFAGNSENMAITEALTPTYLTKTAAKWITSQLSVGYSGVSAPVIANGAMYFQNASRITKLDLETGEIDVEANLANECGYSPAAVAYGDGQIFVAENNGTIEAFDAETLERTWVYKDAVGGQACAPVTYKDGYVYTGFYATDADYNKVPANYVCVEASAADGAEKTAVWTYEDGYGYYWAGACVTGDYVVFGGEAATGAETSVLTVVDRVTGEVVSQTEVEGNVRSCVSYSEETGKLYFTSTAGYLYEAWLIYTNFGDAELDGDVDASDALCVLRGVVGLTTLSDMQVAAADVNADGAVTVDDALMILQKVVKLTNSFDGMLTQTQKIALGGASTSTPVVHNNKAYVGVSGPSQFGTEGHTVKVINLEDGTINYEVPMDGYPQCTLLLSTAYEEESGKVFLYATENSGCGEVKLIVDSEGQTEAEVYTLYTAPDDLKNYCMASIVCDQDGTLYYTNDSGCYFALEAVDTVVSEDAQE